MTRPSGRSGRLYGRCVRVVQGPRGYFPRALLDCAPRFSRQSEHLFMGKGDIKSRRGKIYRGSFGKSRPKDPAKKKAAAAKALKR